MDDYLPEHDVPQIVNIPAIRFLMIDGEGSPSSPEFGLEGDALVRVSFALGLNRRLPPLEALWWTADGSPMGYGNLEQWRWTAMLPCPPSVADEAVSKAIVGAQHWQKMPVLDRVRIETFDEGQVVQSLFVGHPAKKEPLIAKIRAYAGEQGYSVHGKYHETYVSNPMRVPLDECQTVVRWPVVKE